MKNKYCKLRITKKPSKIEEGLNQLLGLETTVRLVVSPSIAHSQLFLIYLALKSLSGEESNLLYLETQGQGLLTSMLTREQISIKRIFLRESQRSTLLKL